MSKLPRFRVIFEEEAAEFILSHGKRRRRRLMDICYAIAKAPHAEIGFILKDADGRAISHVSTEGFLVSYWVDAFAKRIVIVELEEQE